MNVTVHAAETSSERLVGEYLPLLLEAAAEVDVVVEPGDAAHHLTRVISRVTAAPDRDRRGLDATSLM